VNVPKRSSALNFDHRFRHFLIRLGFLVVRALLVFSSFTLGNRHQQPFRPQMIVIAGQRILTPNTCLIRSATVCTLRGVNSPADLSARRHHRNLFPNESTGPERVAELDQTSHDSEHKHAPRDGRQKQRAASRFGGTSPTSREHLQNGNRPAQRLHFC